MRQSTVNLQDLLTHRGPPICLPLLADLFATGYWLPGYKLEKSWGMGIHVCVMYNALETALVLLQAGAGINQMPNGKTPLHVACEVSSSDFVTLLLAHGAKVNIPSLSGHTPLHYCVTAESVDCAKQLIVKGQDGRMHGVMEVKIQTMFYKTTIVLPYEGAKVSMSSQNNNEDTPLHTAARFGIPELSALYLAHGASVNAVNSLQETPLMTAAFWAFDPKEQTYRQDHHLVCRILLDHKAGEFLDQRLCMDLTFCFKTVQMFECLGAGRFQGLVSVPLPF